MSRRLPCDLPSDRDQRVQRARDTLAFCEAMYQVHAQSGDCWDPELLALKSLQRAALAVLQENCDRSDWF